MISFAVKILDVAALINAKGNSSPRIIGGYEIEIDVAPYTVQVEYEISTVCGGAILSEKFVATAAHCLYPEQETYVRAGTTYYREDGQLIKAKKVIKHPEYTSKPTAGNKNYGLIVLEKPLAFSDKVKAIPMAQATLSVATMMLATGWGKSVFQFDSGGPLVYNNTLYGLTSFGADDKTPYQPEAFARISYGYDWFKTNMEDNM